MSSSSNPLQNSFDSYESKQELESPFLNEEYLADEARIAQWRVPVPGVQLESPILEAFEEGWTSGEEEQLLEQEIIGDDTRVLVKNTLDVPHRWICAIDILIDNPKWGSFGEPQFISKSRATGILIGPKYVLTASHILDRQTKMLVISPARNESNSDGNFFGKVKAKTIRVSASPYWLYRRVSPGSQSTEITVKQKPDDYALIILEKALDSSTHSKMKGNLGYWGQDPAMAVVRTMDPKDIKDKQIVVIGYPGDTCGKDKFSGSKSEKESKIANCWNRKGDEWASTQWSSEGTLQVEYWYRQGSTQLDFNMGKVFHTADTYAGQSGAPICLKDGQQFNLIGIHTGEDNNQRNRGVRVTRRMLWELCQWINTDAGYKMASIQNDALVVQPKGNAEAKELFDSSAREAEDFSERSEWEDFAQTETGYEQIEEFETSSYPSSEALQAEYSLEAWMPSEAEMDWSDATNRELNNEYSLEAMLSDEAFSLEALDRDLNLAEELETIDSYEMEEFTDFEDELLLEFDESETNDLIPEEETHKVLSKKLKFLSLLPHTVEIDSKDVILNPSVMNPGIYDDSKNYKIASKLQECLMGVMKKKEFSHIKVALVDLTKDPTNPDFAGFNDKSQVYVASVAKIAVMLAAFQLRQDLRTSLKQKGSKNLDELYGMVRDDWAATQSDPKGQATPSTVGISLRGKLLLVQKEKIPLGEPKAPQLEKVFANVPTGIQAKIEFQSTSETKIQLQVIIDEFNNSFDEYINSKKELKKGKKGANEKLKLANEKLKLAIEKIDKLGFLERMRIMIGGFVPVSNYATSTIVRDVGFLYIASTLLQSGLYDTNRNGGLWLGSDYWSNKWRGALGGGSAQSATAGSLAAFMTLLAQNHLVSLQASSEMVAMMKKEPNFTHPGIVSWFKDGLQGLKNNGSLLLVLSKLGVDGGVDDCTFIEREVNLDSGKTKKKLRYVAIGLRAKSGEKGADELKKLILELDKCILANNGISPSQGGHL
jgi:V8-like Glu-specific endopeptidase